MANEQTSVPLYASSEILTAANMNISAGTGVPVFATTVTRDAAFGGANEKVLAEGQLCYLSASNIVQYYDGAAWATVGPTTATTMAIFNETQTGGTAGGASVTGSFLKRTLNTSVQNGITGCSIASSVVTLATAGTYYLRAITPGSEVDSFQCRIQDTTNAVTVIYGGNAYSGSGLSNGVSVVSIAEGYLTVTASTNLEVQQRNASVKAGSGLGNANGFTSSIYSILVITRIS